MYTVLVNFSYGVDVVVARLVTGARSRVGDLASVEDAHTEMRVNTRFNGEPCVKLNVLKHSGVGAAGA